MAPDNRMETIVIPFIWAFIKIYPTKSTQRIIMKPAWVCESLRFAIIERVITHKDMKKED